VVTLFDDSRTLWWPALPSPPPSPWPPPTLPPVLTLFEDRRIS
jgi:hypothetical protein